MKLTDIKSSKPTKKVMSKVGTQRIYQQDVESTIDYISSISGIPREELHILGSTGKTPTSGDIDLAVDITKFNINSTHQRLISALGPNNVNLNSGFKIGSYAIPIAGKKANGLVQVDLMFVPDVNWAKFSYFSAGTKSQYKGAVRNILLSAIATAVNQPGIDQFINDDATGQMVIRIGRTFDLNSGIRRIFQHRPKTDIGYSKSLKTVFPDELQTLYPDLVFDNRPMTVTDPELVGTTLFGDENIKPIHIETAEQVMDLIKTKFTPYQQQQIYKVATEKLSPLSGKMNVPKFESENE